MQTQFGVAPSPSGPLAQKLERDRLRLRRLEAAQRVKAQLVEEARLIEQRRALGLGINEVAELLNDEARFQRGPASPLSGRRIMRRVAAEHNVSVGDLRGPRGSAALTAIRHEAMYIIARDTLLSLPQIGKLFNRDHTSVIHGTARHAARQGLPLPRQKRVNSS